jgi:UDP-N-acetylglucosamine--N-acetylmuramyl-(pentapeptide) pyrophosphoryl-undecaprenol N-acetylglucosamine transferase
VLRTGVAIRRGFEPVEYGYDGETLKVLILGGSQGAKSLNDTLPRALHESRATLRVTHQAGKGHDAQVRELYEQLGADVGSVQVVPFINEMPTAIARADLVIGRSGAGAVSEICAVGRPSLLIPYPYASGDHQFKNASRLVDKGAAVCLRTEQATVPALTQAIDELASDPARLRAMAAAATALGRPDAAEAVAADLLDLGNIQFDEQPGDGDFDDSPGDASPAPSEVH